MLGAEAVNRRIHRGPGRRRTRLDQPGGQRPAEFRCRWTVVGPTIAAIARTQHADRGGGAGRHRPHTHPIEVARRWRRLRTTNQPTMTAIAA